ncbi:VWA domain-containing protein [Methanoculleus methanifontis]|nr:VWA domain-containing protein [Methanoculleus sp. FWC-SCC3]
MSTWIRTCIIITGLLLLAVPAAALVPDTIEVVTSSEWLTAGSGETATITVLVTNGSDGVSGVVVNLAVDSAYGSISPAHVITASDGTAAATFRPGTRSGTATIAATVSDGVDAPLTGSGEQQIDHAAPYELVNTWYDPEVTVGETTEIIVRMEDRYGNVVDGRNVIERVLFTVSPPAGFVDGESLVDVLSVSVDAVGNATATLRVDTVAGENLVWIRPPAPIGSDMISIAGIGGYPVSITQVVVPESGSVPADGKTRVSCTYTLLDEYGNPVSGHGIWVNATLIRLNQPDEQESRLLNTSSLGRAMITYGPEDSVGRAIITATAAANASASASQDVEFTSTEPVNMLLSASPQSMPSRDVNDGSVSQLRAKVMDIRGNPVKGETVTFEIVSTDCTPYVQTRGPELAAASGVTDIDGYATVEFHPGAFTTDPDVAGWSETATGTAIVRATWGNVSRDIELTWKNYPYLSVETEVSPETVAVNDTVDVTIRLKGDGWALQPDPIDVVLVIDRSGSMKYDIARNSGTSNERMEAAQDAANNFVAQMNSTRDRVGLVSFASDARLDAPLTNDKAALESKIDDLEPTGATNMREAFYTAISHLRDNGRPEAVKAVILMSDGDWNYHGTPLGHGIGLQDWTWSGNTITYDYYEYYDGLGGTLEYGWITVPKVGYDGYYYNNEKTDYCPSGIGEVTNQNMSNYAIANNISLYTITFAYNPDNVRTAMETLANSTDGFYEHAPDADDLTDIYERIAGELKTEAGVDTELDVVFENVEVNGNLTTGTSVFDYVHEEDVSTTIESWIDNETVDHYEIIPRYTRDDTPNWTAANPHLPFNIGTVRLGQTWETTFRLAVKTEGNINIFGPGSTISFNNGTDSLELPDTFITAVPLNNTGMDFAALEIKDLVFTGTGPIDEFFPVAWDLNYTGLYDVTEDVFYSNDNEYTWVKFDTLSATNTTTGGTSTLDVRGLPPGEYIIWVRGSAPDTADSSDKITMDVRAGATGDAYIRIQ